MRNLCLDMLRKNQDEIEFPPEVELFEPNPHQQIEQKVTAKSAEFFKKFVSKRWS